VRTHLDCLPCFVRQGLEASRFVTDDPALQETILRETLRLSADVDLRVPPVAVGQIIHRRLREMTGSDDPYRAVKSEQNRLVAGVLEDLATLVRQAPDPLVMAARLAIAANVIDLGVPGELTPDRVLSSLHGVLDEPFHGDVDAFVNALEGAESILYLADNAGEIVADKLLIDEIGPGRVTVAVRGGPVINDATRADAEMIGLTDVVDVIDNGSDAPGTILDDCDDSFRKRFDAADLIIAKGQGNFETLGDVDAPLFFLFKVKCQLVASHTGLPLGTHALLSSRDRPR
jgi:uncharacterized protein with ATP-grasp and redox domains